MNNKKTSEHTPTPWKITGMPFDTSFPLAIEGADGFRPAAVYGDGILNRGTTKANAELIVRAVNSHEALVNAARYATCPECRHNRCQLLRDALAKAEGRGE
jgi:hypothetical protein